MDSPIRSADLWALRRRLGYDGDRLVNHNRHRVCEHEAAGLSLTRADYPPGQAVHPQTLYGVRLAFDHVGLWSRAEFDRWADRRTRPRPVKANGRADELGKICVIRLRRFE